MCEKLLFTLFFIVDMPWCTVHVPWTVHQALVFKTKEAKNTQTWKLQREGAIQTRPYCISLPEPNPVKRPT